MLIYIYIYLSPSLPPSPYICVSVSFSWILFPIVLRTLGTHIKIPHWNSLLLQYYKYVSCDTKSLLIIIILLSTKIKNKFLKVSYPINCRDQLIQVQLWHLQKCWFPSTALFLRKMALHLRRHVFHIIGLFLFFLNFFFLNQSLLIWQLRWCKNSILLCLHCITSHLVWSDLLSNVVGMWCCNVP